MQLRKIELVGFKSFADRTELSFDKGITAIVGPNGCGKSNVVDAVRWVLGEQSARSLRATQMSDCIFAGTAARKPLGFAEVTLIFDNASGRLALPYEEVAVTRRAYGSGESEYLINKQLCRLKDVRELFMGTGVGTTAYSVIEQGEITRIVSSDPRELRAVFDEAAGIALYKTRLRAAAAKLDRVSQNLLRVEDVLGEVEKSLRSVKYQAAKARRYQEMTARLTDVRLNRSRRAYADYSSRLSELSESLSGKRAAAAALESRLASIEADGDRAGSELASLEALIQDLAASVSRLDGDQAELRHTIDICRERIAHHSQNEVRLAASVRSRRADLEAFETRTVELERRTGSVRARTDRLSRAASVAAGREREAADLERAFSVGIASAENESVEVLRAGVKLDNRLSELEAGERASAQQKSRLAGKLAEMEGTVALVNAETAELNGVRQALSARAEVLKSELETIALARTAAETVSHAIRRDMKAAGERLAAVTSRRELLDDLQKRREGVSDAARSMLEMGLPGTRGLVADLLVVPRDLTAAVEGLLGDDAAAVVFDSTAAAFDAVSRLSSDGLGRAKAVSLERAATHAPRPCSAVDGLVPVAPRVAAAPGCEPLVNALLGDCLLARDLAAAVAANGHTVGLYLATPSGETVGPDGGVSGGSGGQTGGLIWRKAEIEDLMSSEQTIRVEIDGLDSRRVEMEAELARLSSDGARIEGALSEVSTRSVQAEGRILACEARKTELSRERAVVENEISTLDSEIAGSVAERDAVLRKINEVRAEGAVLQRKIETLKARRDAAVDNRERSRLRVTRLKVALASSLEKQASLERQYADAREALEEKARALEAASREIETARNAVAAEEERMRAAEAQLESTRSNANSSRIVLAARRGGERALRDDVARLAPQLKQARLDVDAARQEISDLTMAERETSIRFQDLVARCREEFQATVEALSAPAVDADPAAEDAEIEELNRKLAGMGGVNMEALAELDELENRYNFLSGQRKDLVDAKESLEGIITKTRATSRKMFMESFESIRENFAAMFRRLFGGGRADCILLNPEDVLESPIQIMAKPPGKEPSNLNLLSGGEKAMTAVALLFAMFATRPSPFLVLDEVDAPLDESNIGRFIDLMGDYLPTCQFVVITHNRRTMSAADALYGITMEEEGVSKKVSVSFNRREATPEPVTV